MPYSQLEENDTALCLQKLAAGFNHRVELPTSTKPHVFTNQARDNISRLEENLTGKGPSQITWYSGTGKYLWSTTSQSGTPAYRETEAEISYH